MYLKTVSELAPGGEMVPISALAKRLGVSTVSATEMIHRLQDQALVEHVPYKGIHLTEAGAHLAMQIERGHRLWERFLVEHLALPWEDVHDMACRLEHLADERVVEALADFLGQPETCPHGNPIPRPGETVSDFEDITLADLNPGEGGRIRAIHPESNLLLEHLARNNLKPGRQIFVTEIAPFNGPIMVDVDGETRAVGQEVATHILVEPEQS
jgi:DtxR family Mn-dependent transcriptional regulator